MASCLLASGIDPEKSILFQQSQVCYICFNLIETVDLMETYSSGKLTIMICRLMCLFSLSSFVTLILLRLLTHGVYNYWSGPVVIAMRG